ncbi:MAG: monovalent cation/H+ antiporter complex subunit F [Lachnospiraceae bacterium]|nr:monovalent cation/H+ antiporter complex subunit F [Lachnospiraceae bacterium]
MSGLEKSYEVLFISAMIVLAILIICALIRAVIGPRIADRIMAINMIGTMTIMIVFILSLKMKEDYLLDIGSVYAMISFLAVVILSKVYMGVHLENSNHNKQKEEETS